MELRVENGILTLPYGANLKVFALGDIVGEAPAILRKLDELAKAIASKGNLKPYISHVNHPNLQGHKLIAV